LIKWVPDYEDAFTELVLLGQTTWDNDDTKKRCLVQNAQNIGMVDTVFDALMDDESFSETCNFCSVCHMPSDMINMPKKRTQDRSIIHANLMGTIKKDKVKTINKDTIKVPKKDRTNSSNMPNNYAKVKNTMKGEEELQDSTEQDYGFIDALMNSLKRRSILPRSMNHSRKQTMIIGLQSIIYIQVSV
jgi:hypothetical protein